MPKKPPDAVILRSLGDDFKNAESIGGNTKCPGSEKRQAILDAMDQAGPHLDLITKMRDSQLGCAAKARKQIDILSDRRSQLKRHVKPEYDYAMEYCQAFGTGRLDEPGLPEQLFQWADATPASTERVDWHDIQERLLTLCRSGQRYTTLSDLAERLTCGNTTVNKAIKDSPELEAWQTGAKPPALRAQSLNEVVTDRTSDPHTADPADVAADNELDARMAEVMDKATPKERAELNAMGDNERRELAATILEQAKEKRIQDEARKGSKLLGRKP